MKSERLIVAMFIIGLLASDAHAVLVSHWTFDESSGSTAYDSTGLYDGTLAGGATFVGGGISGNAISLSKASGSLVNMGTSFPGFTSGDFSLVAWVKTTTTAADSIFLSKHASGSGNGYFFNINTTGIFGQANKAMFYQSTAAGTEPISTTTVNNGTWHQIVGVHVAGGNTQIFVDGAPAERTKTSSAIIANTAPFIIGGLSSSGTPTATFDGLVDDVQVYNQALTSSEIQILFDHPGQAVPEPSTASLLAFGLAGWAAIFRRNRKT